MQSWQSFKVQHYQISLIYLSQKHCTLISQCLPYQVINPWYITGINFVAIMSVSHTISQSPELTISQSFESRQKWLGTCDLWIQVTLSFCFCIFKMWYVLYFIWFLWEKYKNQIYERIKKEKKGHTQQI
jgi:hypothetical protein